MAPRGKKRALAKDKTPSKKRAPPPPKPGKAKQAAQKLEKAKKAAPTPVRASAPTNLAKSKTDKKKRTPPSEPEHNEREDFDDEDDFDEDEDNEDEMEDAEYMDDLMNLKQAWQEEEGVGEDKDDDEDDENDDEDGDDAQDEDGGDNFYTHTEVPGMKKDIFSSFENEDEDGVGLQDDEFDGEDDEDIDEDEDGSRRRMTLEEKSRLLDEMDDEEAREAQAEMERMVREEQSIYNLTEEQADEQEGGMQVVEDLDITMQRINDVIDVLSHFKARREPGRSRSDYTDQLSKDLATYFEYLPELIDTFMKIFSPKEILEFLEANEKQRPVVIRTNTLKTRRKDLAKALVQRGVTLEPLAAWSKVGIKITEAKIPIGATPEYLAGHYILQAASSMCSVLALAPMEKERVLDMASAPGGKTSYIAQLMKNTGCVVANDLKRGRLKATTANLARLGVSNTIVCNYDGREFPKVMGKFDRVLLDAPCTGLGVIARDASIKIQKTYRDVQKMSQLQKQLALAAVDSVDANSKTGAVFVYSTCSIAVEENEQVVQYILDKRPNQLKLVDVGFDVGLPGFTRFQQKRFHPSLSKTRRFYPHVHNMDGFYVAKFLKYSNIIKSDVDAAADSKLEMRFGDNMTAEEKKNALRSEKKRKKNESRKERIEQQASRDAVGAMVVEENDSDVDEDDVKIDGDEQSAAVAELSVQEPKRKKSKSSKLVRKVDRKALESRPNQPLGKAKGDKKKKKSKGFKGRGAK